MKSVVFASLIALALSASQAAFEPKNEYIYKFDGLLLAGLPTNAVGSDNSQTHIQCRARLQAIDDRYIHLQLNNIQVSAAHLPQTQQWNKLSALEQRELVDEHRELLELPVRAQIRNGLVSELQFASEDAEWSKNVKRAVLNMLSIQMSAPVNEMSQELIQENNNNNQFYTLNEKTIEGDCEVSYTRVQEGSRTVYTKSVNFEKCIARPETVYGLQFESKCQECKQKDDSLKPTTVYTYIFENERLQEVEVESHYTLSVSGQEIIKSETRSRLVYENDHEINNEIRKINGEKEELIYSTQWEKDVEEFFKLGDKMEKSPFEEFSTANKLEQIQKIVDQIVAHKQNSPESVHLFARLVRLFRMFTIEELKTVHTTIYGESDVEIQLRIENALAVAGTRNTIQHLIHHIENGTIAPLRAARLLKSIQETQYPSEQIADLLIQLARSSVAKTSEVVRQSAWLAAGSVVRGFVSQNKNLPLYLEQSKQIKQKFVRVFMQHFRTAETTYEQILALKTLGNAGIDLSVFELSEIIVDQRQPLPIRTEAVDALRLLKDVMPRKIQKVLLPVYKNRQFAPELRMAALWRMMHTQPEQPVLAQIVSQMENESNQHVAAFTYNVVRQFSKSTNPCYQRLAALCSRILLLTKYQPSEQVLSTYSQLPLFNGDLLSGVQFDFTTIFQKTGFLPKDIQITLETVFGGNWNQYFAQLGFSQQNLELILQSAIERLQQLNDNTNQRESRPVQAGIKLLEKLLKKLSVRSRLPKTDIKNAHALLYLRYKEMDFAVLPINKETIHQLVDQYFRKGVVDIGKIQSVLSGNHELNVQQAAFFYEVTRKIPTTVGFPLIFTAKLPTLLSIQGNINVEFRNLETKITFDVKPSLAATHLTQLKFWTPLFDQGIKSLQSVTASTPMKLIVNMIPKRSQLEFVYKIVVPENQKTVFGLSTRPVAFLRFPTSAKYEYVEAEEKTVYHPQLQWKTEEVEKSFEYFGIQMNVLGNVLNQWSIENVLLTEQNIEYVLENNNQQTEFTARFSIHQWQNTDLSEIKFDKMFEKEFDLEEKNSQPRREAFHKMIRNIQKEQGFKQLVTLKLEAPQQRYINSEVELVCNNDLRVCKVELSTRASPFVEERNEWTFYTTLVAALPQAPVSLRQLREQPHREIQFALNSKWGFNKKSEMTIVAQLEQSRDQKKFGQHLEHQFSGLPEYELLIKAARLNQLNVVASYKLTPEAELTLSHFFNLFKVYNFWSVSERSVENQSRRAVLQLTVEPVGRQFLNLTVQTPEREVKMINVRIPRVYLPSIAQRSFRHHIMEKSTSSCQIDQSQVSTFDQVVYRAPLTNSYSLIVADCTEKPQFSVLAKKLNKNSEELKIQINKKRREEEITVEKINDEFLVKTNGKRIPTDQLSYYDIELLGDNHVVIQLPSGEVKFDGYKVKTNLLTASSNVQICGLCGNNDGETDNEFYTADNYKTEDVEEFHRSYILEDEQYDSEDYRLSDKKNYKKSMKPQQRDNEWENESDYEQENNKKTTALVKKTLVKEFSHRVCFSLEPVNECARNMDAEKTTTKKIRFTCMSRHNSNARRFLKDSREQILSLEDYPVSYVEAVKVPTACVAF